MLQIISGKLFNDEICHTNKLKGVLYTNLTFNDETISTVIGDLIPLSNLRSTGTITCEIQENIEGKGIQSGLIHSYGIEPFISELSTIVSFALNAICTPNPDLVKRLTSESPGIGIHFPPNKYISRIYEKEIRLKPEDCSFLQDFTKKLIDLPREKYLVAIRAIRTYITSMHRMSDDLELAYTLLVASIESLAQNFDGHKSTWPDYAHEKRAKIDKALEDASTQTSEKVREAILSIEHVALGKRFRSFTLDYLPKDFFTNDALKQKHPVGRANLSEALRHAYSARSDYIHELLTLPRELLFNSTLAETIVVDNKTTLTFQGLSRVARQVIIEFINRQESITKEPYDYNLERPGVFTARLSPEMWITNINVVTKDNGQDLFEGFLHTLSECLRHNLEPSLPYMRDSIKKSMTLLPNMNETQQRPYILLCYIWNILFKNEHSVYIEETQKITKLANEPSIDSLLAHAITGNHTDWTPTQQLETLNRYYKKRETPTGIRVLPELEMCLGLGMAECFRLNGDFAAAREQLLNVADNFPATPKLRDFMNEFSNDKSIIWLTIVYPYTKPLDASNLELNGL